MLKIVLFSSLVFLISCNTYIVQNISKRVQGTWIRTPLSSTQEEKWIFENGKTTIMINDTIIGIYDYTIENNLNKDYITIHGFRVQSVERWRIIKISKNELYLISIFEGIKGGFHRTFYNKN